MKNYLDDTKWLDSLKKDQFHWEKIVWKPKLRTHKNLLPHTEIRWLKLWSAPSKLFELKDAFQKQFLEVSSIDFEACLLKAHWKTFLSWQPVEQAPAKPGENVLTWSDTILGLKKISVFEKIMLQNEIFKYFHCCLDLKVRKDIKFQVLLKTSQNNWRLEENEICNSFLWIFASAWKCDCHRIKNTFMNYTIWSLLICSST